MAVVWFAVVVMFLKGSCISGIIGTKILKFCLHGDLVETAAAMERSGTPDCIHASEDFAHLVPEEPWQKKTTKNDKGKRQTYLLYV